MSPSRTITDARALLLVSVLLAGCAKSASAPPLHTLTGNTAASASSAAAAIPMDIAEEPASESSSVASVSGVTIPTRLSAEGTIHIGSADAPLTLTAFLDFGCDYCRQFGREDLPWLLRSYVQPGRVKLEFVMRSVTPSGDDLARAALCALEQGRFPEVADYFYERDGVTSALLLSQAKLLKLNSAELKRCMSAERIGKILSANAARAESAGIKRVPAFRLGEKQWLGIVERYEWEKMIQEQL